MDQVRARVLVDDDHHIAGTAPPDVPPGEHDVLITIAPMPAREPAMKPFNVDELPVVDLGPWPEGITLRREEIYGDDGR